jgi:O-antigen/teichoic acid export membrane protein
MPAASANSSLVYFLGRLVNLLLAPAAIILLPGILGQDGYGQYSYWFGLITVYIIAFDAGAQPMLRRFLPELIESEPARSFSLFRAAMLLKLFMLPLLIVNTFLSDDPKIIIWLLLAALLASLATNLADVYYSYQKMGLHSITVLSRRIIRLVLVPLLFIKLGFTGIIIALVVAEILGFIISIPALNLFSRPKETLAQPFLRYYRQGIVMFLAMFASVFIGRSPVFFAEWNGLDVEIVGRVALCVDLSYFALKELINAISESILPRLISLYAGGKMEKMQSLISQNYRIVNFVTLWFVSLGIGLAEPGLRLLGEDFYMASLELQFLLALVIFSSWNLIHNQLLIIEEKSYLVLVSQCAGLLFAVSVILIYRHTLSIEILVLGLGGAMICSCIVSYLVVRKKYNARISLRYFIIPLILAMVLSTVLGMLNINGVYQVSFAAMAGSLFYLVMMYISKGIHKEDLRLTANLLSRKKI